MRIVKVLVLALCICAAGALARTPEPQVYRQLLGPGAAEDGTALPQAGPARQDTLWFGGDDGMGNALFSPNLANPEDASWTWDHGGPDPYEGWTTVDKTEDDAVYFYRVTAASFAGDPCVPMFTGETGQLWCGMHETDADNHDWLSGMGYGNSFCQRAFSPMFACAGQKSVTVNWKMFNDSEIDFDYTYLYVLAYDSYDELIEEIEVVYYDGQIGSHTAPVTQNQVLAANELPTSTSKVQVEFRFFADEGWSDEDGLYMTDCGPCAMDEIKITIQGSPMVTADFETGTDGWTFGKCEGVGAFMAVWDQTTWEEWATTVNLPCGCTLDGNALGCIDPASPFPVPGHPTGQIEQMFSGLCTLDRNAYPASEYNTTFAEYDAYFYLRQAAGTFYRPGFVYHPYTSEVNPNPHWSPRLGQDLWYHTGTTPNCQDGWTEALSINGLVSDWEKMRFIFEFSCSCEFFGIDPPNCRYEGQTYGAPLIDNLRVGVCGLVDAPAIAVDTGHLFHDGFGQNFPTYLEPGDVGNSDIAYDYSRDDAAANDMLSDSAMVEGPMPTAERQWLCNLVFKLESKGPRQDLIPGYHYWKSRLSGDPETEWVSVLMDSAQATATLVSAQAFATYFHEDDPGFRGPVSQDYNELNEILPDGVFVPGTTVRYYYAPYWTDTPEIQGYLGLVGGQGWEYEILPSMRLVDGSDWDVEWPSVLYVDAYNGGAETYIAPLLDQLQIEYDKYDAQNRSSNYDASMKRSFINGAWGNNGCTTQQLLGYRLILFNTGTLSPGSMEEPDFVMFDEWLDATDCPDAAALRRGLILNGDEIVSCMDHPLLGVASDLLNLKFGASYVADAYRTYNDDEYDCVGLLGSGTALFTPASPGASLYGNDCPRIYDYNVLDTHATGGTPAVGNLLYQSYNAGATGPTVEFAQVVRAPATTNWRTVVDGFSFHHLSEYGGPGNECEGDSARIVDGAANLLGPELQWIIDVNDPFVYWQYPCEDSAVDDTPDGHLAGPVSYLHASRPNPFRNSATIRFHLAQEGPVDLSVFDVTGRLVRTLVDGDLKAGENSVVWDGTDNSGDRVSGGVFWMQMSTPGFTSSKRMVVLR